jgi:response regulator RpfG family c-di-GMP phosphodiesterase
MYKILLVDDERNVLNALQRELKDRYEIEAFNDPVAAIKHCAATQFDLVIADYKMPEMNGIEFLKQFRQLQPDASRILLSGEADINALIRLVNETHIYRFLSKPWEKQELLSSISHALAHRDAILENHRQGSLISAPTRKDDGPFHIVLVESDEQLLTLQSNALTGENGKMSLFGAIQQELNRESPAMAFKCVVKGFRTAQDAIAYAKNNRCDLVIAAQTLSDMDGIQLLSLMRHEHPNVARILISGSPDKAIMLEAINEAEVQGFLNLHWTDFELRNDARRHAWNLHQLKIAAIQVLASRELVGNALCRKQLSQPAK